MPERKNAKLAKAMSNHEGPFRVTLDNGRLFLAKGSLWQSEVYKIYDECSKGFFMVYNANHVMIFSQEIM